MTRLSKWRMLACGVVSALMSACQTTGQIAIEIGESITSVIQLAQHGYDFSYAEADAKIRRDLDISPRPVLLKSIYGKVDRCFYDIRRRSKANEAISEKRASLVVRPVGDRFMTTLSVENLTSSALINGDGKVYDFNIFHQFNNQRLTTESQGLPGKINLDNKSVGASQIYNPLSLLQPEFVGSTWNANQIISAISLSRDQESLAYLKYKGLSQYNGANVLVIDIVGRSRGQTKGPFWTSIGFSLLDVETRLPVIYLIEFEEISFRLERKSCLATKT